MNKFENPTAPKTTQERWELFLGFATNLFVDGWLLMLLFGVLHASAHIIPTFGYWQSFFVGFVLAGLASSGAWSVSRQIKKLGLLVQAQTATKVLSDALTGFLKTKQGQ